LSRKTLQRLDAGSRAGRADWIAFAGRNGFRTVVGASAFPSSDEAWRGKAEAASQRPPLLVFRFCKPISDGTRAEALAGAHAGGEAALAAVASAAEIIRTQKTRDKVMEQNTQNIIYENNIASAQ
jgi:hypothetical protein